MGRVGVGVISELQNFRVSDFLNFRMLKFKNLRISEFQNFEYSNVHICEYHSNIANANETYIRIKKIHSPYYSKKLVKEQNSNICEYSINIRIFAFANIIRIVRNRICLDYRNVRRTFQESTIQEFEYLQIFEYSINIRIFAFANIIRIVQNRICLDSRNVHRTFRESTIQQLMALFCDY